MAELKTKPTTASVDNFVNGIVDSHQRADSKALIALMKTATRKKPKMWGLNMIGFGEYHYMYASGREGDVFLVGFAPRKGNLTLYLWHLHAFPRLLAKLGKCKTGKGCLYIKRLADVDRKVLRELVAGSLKKLKQKS